MDTVGFEPGILSADGRIPHSDRLHVVERFTLDPAGGTLVRSYVAEDPRYLQKPYTGSDTVYLADVPYQPAPCDDQSYKKASTGTGAWPRWTLGALVALGAALLVWLARARPRPGRAG